MNLEAKLSEVHEEYLRRMTQGDSTLLRQVEHYATRRNGKMLRPRLLLAAAATLGTEHFHSRRTLLLAVCVEMLHNASLLHDDVIDRALTRRGQPSVNAHWNNSVAVLVGDYCLAQIMQLLDEVDDRDATRRINRTVINMVEAELLAQEISETSDVRCEPLSPLTYINIIDGKTAQLFATACALGNPAYEDYGLHYGRLFQLRDDLADGEATPWTEELIQQEESILAKMQPLAINIQ
ncbi:MAG: polyprenyl synthetase family protein [Bacteroidales bacterium]|nr:polyprenyl synthetase family protein [Bacteroidales bacterium]